MERIAVIGCGGSGKSTLARRLGKTLGLPVHHLDRLFWKPGWVETPRDDWAALQKDLCSESRWIIDGNYSGTMEVRFARADTVIFLDLPAWRCLLGAVRRYLRYRGQTRPDLADGCTEQLTSEYLRWIWSYRKTRRARILHKLRQIESTTRIVILDSYTGIKAFLSRLSQGDGMEVG